MENKIDHENNSIKRYRSVKDMLHENNIQQFYANGYSKEIIDRIFQIAHTTKINKTVVMVLSKVNHDALLKHMILNETQFLDDAIANGICKQHDILITERLYCILNGIHEIPFCKVCGKLLKNFKVERTSIVHYQVCSLKCSNADVDKITKRVNSYMSRSPEEKYKTKLQTQQTIENRFGNKCFMKSEYFKEKKLKYIKDNGGECNVSQIKFVRAAVDKTNIDNYGNRCNLANAQQQELRKQTYAEHFGVDHPMKNAEFVEDFSNKLFEKHGVRWISQTQTCKDKAKKRFQELRKHKIEQNEYVIPLFNLNKCTELELFGRQYWWQCLECGHVFASHIIGFPGKDGRVTICPFCRKPHQQNHSSAEYQIVSFLKQTFSNLEIIHNDNKVNRHIIPPYELDIWIPEKNIAIEYNGVFWHSIEFNDQYLKHSASNHFNLLKKTQLCEQKGIHLIHVYESEWLNQQDKTKQLLIDLINNKEITTNNYNVIHLPYDKYSSFTKIDGYELVEITSPTIVAHTGMKMKTYHMYDCGELIFKHSSK